jgi:predicted dehydrogenase
VGSLQAAPTDIRVVRAVEPNMETVKAVCAEKGVLLSANYADALGDPAVEAVVLATGACRIRLKPSSKPWF